MLVWFVTGCSSGFGEQFVHGILSRGDKVIATGRNLEKLKHLEQAGADILQLDVTDNQKSIFDTMAKAISIYGKIDVLINNAGFISVGTWEDPEYAALFFSLTLYRFAYIITGMTSLRSSKPTCLARLRSLGHCYPISASDGEELWCLLAHFQDGLDTRDVLHMLARNMHSKVP
jgi:NAD(P)-dependent dehydrogenase (short-subunit alcohol dehydrogenase family)